MAKVPKTTEERLKKESKKYQKILQAAATRDINESDTVLIIRDMLSELFGYDKYTDITAEYAIRGTYCDLVVIVDGKKHFVIEIKAIGLALKEGHMRQAINYATNEGLEWAVLTNGAIWQIYKITFQKPIDYELVFTLDFLNIDPKDMRALEMLYLLSKEGITKSAIEEYHIQNQAMNRFAIAVLLLNDAVISSIRRELKRIHKDVKIDPERISEIIQTDIIKRDIVEHERFLAETKKFKKNAQKSEKCKTNGVQTVCVEQKIELTENAQNENVKPSAPVIPEK
ncbi:MAG: type I restriction enzyme HsdR N-terminal domain-containing protein [bacterium]